MFTLDIFVLDYGGGRDKSEQSKVLSLVWDVIVYTWYHYISSYKIRVDEFCFIWLIRSDST